MSQHNAARPEHGQPEQRWRPHRSFCPRNDSRPLGNGKPGRHGPRLAAGSKCRTAQERLRWRNAVVQENLPLVYAMASRLRHGSDIPLEDLAQVGSIGLIRAVEAFDPSRRVRLSSFAVPYVRGAILHEIRDRGALVRIPRTLWDLRQQIGALQARRRGEGLPPQGTADLAGALGCGAEQVRDVDGLWSVTTMASLDAPLAAGDRGDGLADTLLERLTAAPPEPASEARCDPEQRRWLQGALDQLGPQKRQLLLERFQLNCSWVELGQRHGISARQAQRQVQASLERLCRQAADWGICQAAPAQESDPPSSGASKSASRAASSV